MCVVCHHTAYWLLLRSISRETGGYYAYMCWRQDDRNACIMKGCLLHLFKMRSTNNSIFHCMYIYIYIYLARYIYIYIYWEDNSMRSSVACRRRGRENADGLLVRACAPVGCAVVMDTRRSWHVIHKWRYKQTRLKPSYATSNRE